MCKAVNIIYHWGACQCGSGSSVPSAGRSGGAVVRVPLALVLPVDDVAGSSRWRRIAVRAGLSSDPGPTRPYGDSYL